MACAVAAAGCGCTAAHFMESHTGLTSSAARLSVQIVCSFVKYESKFSLLMDEADGCEVLTGPADETAAEGVGADTELEEVAAASADEDDGAAAAATDDDAGEEVAAAAVLPVPLSGILTLPRMEIMSRRKDS